MDFRSRGAQPHPTQGQPVNNFNNGAGGQGGPAGKLLSWGPLVLLLAGAALIAIIALLLSLGGPGQAKAIDDNRYQAVFLNNGQVYFGKISNLNDKFIDLRNIYYLQTSGGGEAEAQASSNVSLVKLGCELHAPFDQMVINYDQVIFWENLQDSSQVVKAINDYKKQNPGGQKCSEQSQNSTQQAPATNTPESGTATPPANQGNTPAGNRRP